MTISTGERLRELRHDKKLTQEYVAETINATKSLVSMYEAGKRIPSRSTLCKLADLYEVTVDYIMGRSPDEEAQKYYTNEEFKDIYKTLPTVPLYSGIDDFVQQTPTGYATYNDLLVDYTNDNLFYINIKKNAENIWVLAEQSREILPDMAYLVKTGKTIKIIKGSEMSNTNIKNVMGLIKSMTYLY